VKRRAFITLLGGAAAAWPLAAHAQQGRKARIGFLGLVSASSHAPRVAALRAGLRDLGWIEGQNIQIDFRWAEGQYDRLSALAEELVRLNVDVLVTHGSSGALAARKATSKTPIVLTAVADMLALGVITSLARPGSNMTGLSFFNAELAAKRLELMKEAIPGLRKAAVLLNPNNASNAFVVAELQEAAKSLNVALEVVEAGQPGDFVNAFAAMTERQVSAVVIHEDPMLNANANTLAVFAAVKRLPSCGFPEFVRAGGLFAYGINFPALDYRAAAFVDKILKGANPADIPVERATKFNVSINLQTAKALGIDVPATLLARADEVIE
jgi:putative ABC transport system substrate-binding protein